MNKNFSSSLLTIFLICIIGIFNVQQVNAQYNPLFGNSTGTNSSMQIILAPSGNPSPYMQMLGNDNSDYNQAGSINFIAGYNSNQQGVAHSFILRTSSNGDYPRAMQIFQNGQILIGVGRKPSNQTDYKLAVDGKIVAQSLYITNPNNWADFVFSPSYKLMSLPKLEAYLKLNRHLPSVPSANEVEVGGYNLTEMDAKLLQSVEELTIHVIELSKQNARMQVEIHKMRKLLKNSKAKTKK